MKGWRLVGWWLAIVVLLAAGGAGVATHDDSTTTQPGMAGTGGPAFDLVPRRGQGLVKGVLTSLDADNAQAAPLRLPLVITIATRGQGGATITAALVGGRSVSIAWYGGQPLPVSGDGTIDLAGAALSLNPSTVTWRLDGPPRALTPGHYRLGAPVAVGTAGLGTPQDSVAFDAGSDSAIETTGGAAVRLGPAPLHLEGPGRLTLRGRLALRTPTAVRDVGAITFGPGDYQIDLSPAPGGYQIDGILQGAISAV